MRDIQTDRSVSQKLAGKEPWLETERVVRTKREKKIIQTNYIHFTNTNWGCFLYEALGLEAVRNIKMHQPDQTLPFRRLESRREEKAHQNTDTLDGNRYQP